MKRPKRRTTKKPVRHYRFVSKTSDYKTRWREIPKLGLAGEPVSKRTRARLGEGYGLEIRTRVN